MQIETPKIAKAYLIFTIILSVGLSLGAMKLVKYFSLKNVPASTPPVSTVASTPVPSPVLVPDFGIINWKVYQNKEYGFVLKYPDIFTFKPSEQEPSENEIVVGSLITKGATDQKGGRIDFIVRPGRLDITKAKTYSKIPLKDWNIVWVDDMRFYEINGNDAYCNYNEVIASKVDLYLDMIFSDCGSNNKTVHPAKDNMDLILSTFEFTR